MSGVKTMENNAKECKSCKKYLIYFKASQLCFDCGTNDKNVRKAKTKRKKKAKYIYHQWYNVPVADWSRSSVYLNGWD